MWNCSADYSGSSHVPPSCRLRSAPLPSSHPRAKSPRRQRGPLTPGLKKFDHTQAIFPIASTLYRVLLPSILSSVLRTPYALLFLCLGIFPLALSASFPEFPGLNGHPPFSRDVSVLIFCTSNTLLISP